MKFAYPNNNKTKHKTSIVFIRNMNELLTNKKRN